MYLGWLALVLASYLELYLGYCTRASTHYKHFENKIKSEWGGGERCLFFLCTSPPQWRKLMIYYPHTQTTTKTWQNGSQSFILQLSHNGKNGTTPRGLQLLYHLLHLSHAISTLHTSHINMKVEGDNQMFPNGCCPLPWLKVLLWHYIHSNQYQNKLKDKHPITIYYAQHFKSNPLSMLKLVLVSFFGLY